MDVPLSLEQEARLALIAKSTGRDPQSIWKRFQVVTQLPEKDQRAAIRLIQSLAAVGSLRKNGGSHGECHVR